MNQASRRHAIKVKEALSAIDEVFSDSSIPQLATISSLREIREDCEIKIQAIEADLRRQQKSKS